MLSFDGSLRVINVQSGGMDIPSITAFPGVKQVIHTEPRYRLASREVKPSDTIVTIGDRKIGGGNFCILAGPCSVESIEILKEIALFLKSEELGIMRGGAFKPRTSPYSFQGLGIEGLKLLADIKSETGMLVVTEAIDSESVEQVGQVADIIQVGSRNMQNFTLLKQLGKSSKPVLLKRGMSSTLDELLLAAEYILVGGNENVILCERGIRTFDDHSRNTLDLSAIPSLREMTHLPIIVDPSHATGKRSHIASMSKAAMAAGADGIMLEIHPHPEQAFSDGGQTLNFREFKTLISDLRELSSVMKTRIN
jgi:3-deoxy-7-phosphoheptulonate synthase